MADGPECSSFSNQRSVGGEDLILKVFNVFLLLQVPSTFLSFYELTIQMHRGLNDLVLLRKNLHFVDHRLKEHLQAGLLRLR